MNIIIITGPSGSGKTTLGKKLMIELESSYMISTDDFYKTGKLSNLLSRFIKSYFDRNISHNSKLLRKTINKIIKNKEINYSYKYDFIKKRTEITNINSLCIKNLIIEGIFALELLKFIPRKDYLLIRLKIDKEICMKRINIRDHIERGKSKKELMEDFLKAWNIYHNKENSYRISDTSKEIIFRKDPNINIILKKLSSKIQ
tara:strand:- start:902 stop:1507 length:606 start_codon:yes stop_codon:yes gene_type:complete